MYNTAYEIIQKVGNDFYGETFDIKNEETQKAYRDVYDIFLRSINDKKSKGILCIGDIGVGKSAMMKIYQRIFKDTSARFKWVSSKELKDLAEIYPVSQIMEMYGQDFKTDLYIDDIGLMIDVKRYGNTINIISELILERYDLFVSTGIKTHFSSNLPPRLKVNPNNIPTLETVYGSRVLDRLKQMTQVIVFKGESKRK